MPSHRYMNQFQYGLEKMPVRLHMHVSFGASGAPTLDTSLSKGIASISRTSAGLYVITLQDSYNSLLGVNMEQLSTGAQAAPIRNIVSQTVSSSKQITIQYRAVDNTTATDPASGEQLYMLINCRNSSV